MRQINIKKHDLNRESEMVSSSLYAFRISKNQDASKRIYNIFNNNGDKKSNNHIDWQYLKTPSGGSCTCFAVTKDNEDAGVYSVFFNKLRVNDKIYKLAQSIDTLTDEKHRGKALFTRLAKAVYKECENEGVKIVYGFPNSSSGPIFFKRLGWKNVEDPPFIIFPNNLMFLFNKKFNKNYYIPNLPFLLVSFFNKIIKGYGKYIVLKRAEFPREDYDEFWKKLTSSMSFVGVDRDSKFIEWRFLNKPKFHYEFRYIYEKEKLVSILVFRVTKKHKGKIAYIMEILYLPGREKEAEALLSCTIKEIIKNFQVDVILAWSRKSTVSYKVYKRSLFFDFPRSLQEIKLFFGMKYIENIDGNIAGEFYLSYSDSDTV